MADVPAPQPNFYHPVDVMGAYNAGVAARAGQIQNALQQQKLDATNALSPILQANTDQDQNSPTFGKVNFQNALAQAAQDPNASKYLSTLVPMANEASTGQSGAASAATAAQTAQQELATKQNAAFNNYTSGLIKKDAQGNVQPISAGDVNSAVQDMASTGLISPATAATQIIKNASLDDNQRAAWVMQHHMASLPPEGQQQAIYGTPGSINTGGQTLATNTPLGGAPSVLPIQGPAGVVTPQGGIQNTMSPAEVAANMPSGSVPNAAGGMNTGKINPAAAGQSGFVSPGAGGGAPIAAPPANINQMLGGAAPLTTNNDPNAITAAVPAGNVQGGASPLSPTTAANLEAQKNAAGAMGTNSATQYSTDLNGAKGIQDSQYPVQNAIELLKNTNTGNAAETVSGVNKALGAILGSDSGQNAAATNMDELKKNLANVFMQKASGFGADTDQKMGLALAGSPNTSLTTQANQTMLSGILGLSRAKAALPLLAAQSGVADQDYSKWAAKQASQLNPSAFSAEYMKPSTIQKIPGYSADPTKATGDYAKFISSYNIGRNLGLVGPLGSKAQ